MKIKEFNIINYGNIDNLMIVLVDLRNQKNERDLPFQDLK